MARLCLGLTDCLYLGNMNSRRDWGHARDYVEMQWLMLQQDTPDDYVIASGRQYTVRDFVRAAASVLGLTLKFVGEGADEHAVVESMEADRLASLLPEKSNLSYVLKPGQIVVRTDPRYYRPSEVETLLGDPTKAHAKLGWTPRTTFEEMVREMITHDLELAARDALCSHAGFNVPLYEE